MDLARGVRAASAIRGSLDAVGHGWTLCHAQAGSRSARGRAHIRAGRYAGRPVVALDLATALVRIGGCTSGTLGAPPPLPRP